MEVEAGSTDVSLPVNKCLGRDAPRSPDGALSLFSASEKREFTKKESSGLVSFLPLPS